MHVVIAEKLLLRHGTFMNCTYELHNEAPIKYDNLYYKTDVGKDPQTPITRINK